jgi:hypothetical protein
MYPLDTLYGVSGTESEKGLIQVLEYLAGNCGSMFVAANTRTR